MSLVTLPLHCHNSEDDAPDHEAADAEYPVVPIFRHVASMRLQHLTLADRRQNLLGSGQFRQLGDRLTLTRRHRGRDAMAEQGEVTPTDLVSGFRREALGQCRGADDIRE